MTATLSTNQQSLQSWLNNKTNIVWLQPDALIKGFEVSCYADAKISLPKCAQAPEWAQAPAGCHGAVFIWDMEFFEQSLIGQNRQIFLWQALESLSEDLGENLLVIQAPMQTALMALMMQSVTLHTHRSPLTEPLFQMVQGLQQSPVYPARIKWSKPENWIDYSKPLPNGFFKFWKVAEQQLFPKNGDLSNPKREHRPHKDISSCQN